MDFTDHSLTRHGDMMDALTVHLNLSTLAMPSMNFFFSDRSKSSNQGHILDAISVVDLLVFGFMLIPLRNSFTLFVSVLC